MESGLKLRNSSLVLPSYVPSSKATPWAKRRIGCPSALTACRVPTIVMRFPATSASWLLEVWVGG